MTTPRGFRDRSDDSLFTLIGEVPELVRNLVVAEIDGMRIETVHVIVEAAPDETDVRAEDEEVAR